MKVISLHKHCYGFLAYCYKKKNVRFSHSAYEEEDDPTSSTTKTSSSSCPSTYSDIISKNMLRTAVDFACAHYSRVCCLTHLRSILLTIWLIAGELHLCIEKLRQQTPRFFRCKSGKNCHLREIFLYASWR